jgi:hypothetical protein
MKKLLTIALCSLMACSDITAGSGLIISLNVSPTFIQAGQVMQVRVFVRNASAEDKQLMLDECIPAFEIFNASNQAVGPAPRACALDLTTPTTVTTGVEIRIDDTWSGESNTTTAGGAPVYLTPGVYKLRPRALLGSGEIVYGHEISVTIVATP